LNIIEEIKIAHKSPILTFLSLSRYVNTTNPNFFLHFISTYYSAMEFIIKCIYVLINRPGWIVCFFSSWYCVQRSCILIVSCYLTKTDGNESFSQLKFSNTGVAKINNRLLYINKHTLCFLVFFSILFCFTTFLLILPKCEFFFSFSLKKKNFFNKINS
jgi:hypothetical protein